MFGTQMHLATFIFICLEIVILFYLVIYRLARPDDKKTYLNIILISLLIVYNVTGGLLPDSNLPGSSFFQNCIAYATGFITPCFFPYYVLHAFGLEKMRFHAYKGVFLFLIIPYFIFISVYAVSNDLDFSKNLLVIPILYAIWVIVTLAHAIHHKYEHRISNDTSREEAVILFLSISPWLAVPVIDYFNLGQLMEALVTNLGFLLLLGFQMKGHLKAFRVEHEKLLDSEQQLLVWNSSLKEEVEKRTRELDRLNQQKVNTFINLAHDIKTPLTLINNYLDDYIKKTAPDDELNIIKLYVDRLSRNITNLLDIQKFEKGYELYNHQVIINFSDTLSSSLILFKQYALRKNINIQGKIEPDIYIKADPAAINRVINNLLENAINFSEEGGAIFITLKQLSEKIILSVKDEGIGIFPNMHKRIFEPYFQILRNKNNSQGLGLGLPIVNKVIVELNGEIRINSNPYLSPGTEFVIILNQYLIQKGDTVLKEVDLNSIHGHDLQELSIADYDFGKKSVFIIEDNISMLNYLSKKLLLKYNVHTACTGHEALQMLKKLEKLPDLLIIDVMLEKVSGFELAKIISNHPKYKYLPFIFLTASSSMKDNLQGLMLGAIDYIHKPFSIHVLLHKIEAILLNAERQRNSSLENDAHHSGSLHGTIPFDHKQLFEENCILYNLTSREKEISTLICAGRRYKEIADSLFIAEKTVAKHVQNIFEKLGVTNKVELIHKLEHKPKTSS